jgi:hypothetical protein
VGPLPFEGRDDNELGARLASGRLTRSRFDFAYRGLTTLSFAADTASAPPGAVAGTSGVGQQGFDQLSYMVTSFGGDGLSRRTPDGPSLGQNRCWASARYLILGSVQY